MSSRIAIIRLITGEEILTEVTGNVNTSLGMTHVSVKNPVRILVIPSKNDPETPQVALAPWLQFSAKKEHDIPVASIVLEYEPVAEFVNQHKQIHGGLVSPPQKLILPK